MPDSDPDSVLITGGHEIGGVNSFAHGLRQGFRQIGIPAEIIPASRIFSRFRELRDPNVLKILSTTAVFAAPMARRAICIAHGVPRADYQGWRKLVGIIGSFKIANASPGAQLVSVSHYTAMSLRAIFNVHTDAVIHNPAKSCYLEEVPDITAQRNYITYVGRLIAAKNLHRILPAARLLLDETPGLRVCIIGEGEQRAELESMVDGDPRVEFRGTPDDFTVREWLRKTRVFISGNEVEGFGISYLEAITQGCIVAMPASGGGLEICPEKVGSSVKLMPLSWDRDQTLATLRSALHETWTPIRTTAFTLEAAVHSYLLVDSNFEKDGTML